jgi:hypothetical protein
MDELEKATVAYENALRHNPFKVSTLAAAAEVYRRSARPALAVATSVQEPPHHLSCAYVVVGVFVVLTVSVCPSVCPARPLPLAKVPRGHRLENLPKASDCLQRAVKVRSPAPVSRPHLFARASALPLTPRPPAW